MSILGKAPAYFQYMPRILRSTVFTAAAARNYQLRYGREYRTFREFLTTSNDMALDEREDWQLDRLKSLVSDAIANTRYYAHRQEDYRPALGASSLDDALAALPVLTKAALRKQPDAFLNALHKTVTVSSTSGTTGSPMTIQHDRKSLMRRFAFLHDHAERNGIPPFSRSIRLSGRLITRTTDPQPYLYNAFERQYFMSTYHLHERYARAVSDLVHRAQPVFIDGYPSAIAQFVELAASVRPLPASLTHAISTAETLDPGTVERITGAAGITLLDYYSASEGLPFIQQCRHGVYHVRWESGIFEVEREGKYCRNGDGNLVCSSFVQNRTPLIRYATGDWVEDLRAPHQCRCGLWTQTVKGVLGRVEDLVVTRDGRALGMFSYRTLKTIAGLGETQIIQRDTDKFTVLSTGASPDDHASIRQQIEAQFAQALGYPVQVDLQGVDEIPRGPNGKLRLVVSRLQTPPGAVA